MLNQLATKIHNNSKEKGFYDKPIDMGTRLCLIHAEVSEALEAHRLQNKPPGYLSLIPDDWNDIKVFKEFYDVNVKGSFEEEMADIIIRTLDLCAHLEIDIQKHVDAKIKYNSSRPRLHGKKY